MKVVINKTILRSGALLGALAVIFGALGAHALKSTLEPQSLESFITAVRYQMWHALALIGLAFLGPSLKLSKWIYIAWMTGVFLFSGSIYLLTLDELIGVNLSFLGPITPLGGLALIAGWITMAVSATADPQRA